MSPADASPCCGTADAADIGLQAPPGRASEGSFCGVLAIVTSRRVGLVDADIGGLRRQQPAVSSSNTPVYSSLVTGRGLSARRVAKQRSICSFSSHRFSHERFRRPLLGRPTRQRRNFSHPRAVPCCSASPASSASRAASRSWRWSTTASGLRRLLRSSRSPPARCGRHWCDRGFAGCAKEFGGPGVGHKRRCRDAAAAARDDRQPAGAQSARQDADLAWRQGHRRGPDLPGHHPVLRLLWRRGARQCAGRWRRRRCRPPPNS